MLVGGENGAEDSQGQQLTQSGVSIVVPLHW